MKTLITFSFLLSASLCFAEIIRSPIHSIDTSDSSAPPLIKFANGRVAYATDYEQEFTPGDIVEAKIDQNQKLLAIQTMEVTTTVDQILFAEDPIPSTYEPTVIGSYNEANTIFKRLNSSFVRSSECSNRAHVWSNEEFKKNGIKSMKAFIFFTASYINRNKFKWWFHVAPMMPVKHNGKVENYVFDYMFNHTPVTVKEWSDNFVFSKRPCKMTTKFSEYDVNPQTEDCYMIFESMYYWMPGDIHAQETSNQYLNDFNQSAVRAAYSEAF